MKVRYFEKYNNYFKKATVFEMMIGQTKTVAFLKLKPFKNYL